MADKKTRLRKLDCLVAEKIMGWKRVSMHEEWKERTSKNSITGGIYWLCRPEAIPALGLGTIFFEGGRGECDTDNNHLTRQENVWRFRVPNYSTDLNEAFRVMDKVNAAWQLSSHGKDTIAHFQKIYETSPYRLSAHHECRSAAEAICRAALKVLELKHEKEIAKKKKDPNQNRARDSRGA
jgi:hypothetical protein